MNILAIVLIIAAVIAVITGSLGEGLQFLFDVLVIAIIVFLLRVIAAAAGSDAAPRTTPARAGGGYARYAGL